MLYFKLIFKMYSGIYYWIVNISKAKYADLTSQVTIKLTTFFIFLFNLASPAALLWVYTAHYEEINQLSFVQSLDPTPNQSVTRCQI